MGVLLLIIGVILLLVAISGLYSFFVDPARVDEEEAEQVARESRARGTW